MATKVSVSPTSLIDQIVVPGDVVLDLSNMTNQTIKLGSGLRQDNDAISAMRAGKLSYCKPNKYWVEGSHKRYIPRPEDHVLGIVVDSNTDNFWVDIKGPQLALLPVLAFEGGTRRNIPKFEVGTLLYLRVVKTNTGMNPELSCTDASGKAALFGPLRDGFMFETSTVLSRMLLSSPTCPVIEALGKKLSFEIAVGLNGRVWVNSAAPRTVIIVANAMMNSESLSGTQQRIMVEKLLAKISD
ncbi:Nucleic acid-binding OB-fold [Arabidopsis suecica]|uniref:Nucleic acid-binding OB-fold n=1 Tax=Arabidopsis suecica TaxID=45249 RepID=A0A8T1YHB5_ARASU|nr:Nucleic acid-binding OB-fold [Arabidopsis suecica]